MEALFLISRIIVGMFFLFNGVNHFTRLGMMTQYTASYGVPSPRLAVLGTGVLLVLGGLSLLLGVWPWVGAILLIVFLIPTTFMMHRFWGLQDQVMAMTQMAHFMKNLALVGFLLMTIYFVLEHGAGPLSLTG